MISNRQQLLVSLLTMVQPWLVLLELFGDDATGNIRKLGNVRFAINFFLIILTLFSELPETM